MNVTQGDIDELRELWKRAAQEQESYFDRIYKILVREAGSEEQLERYPIAVNPEFMQEADKGVVEWLNKEIPKIVVRLIELSKASPVISDLDRGDLKFSLRELLASLRLHRYQHWGTYIHSDEDRVLGVDPPGQSESECDLQAAFKEFTTARENVQRLTDLPSMTIRGGPLSSS